MQILCGIFLVIALAFSFWVVHQPFPMGRSMDHVSFNNISQKCGVLSSDLIFTTSLKKISDCLDRLSVIKEKPVKIGKTRYLMPPEWQYIPEHLQDDECHAWCRQ